MQRLTSFVLGLLFVVHALGEFTSLAYQGQEGRSMTGNVLASDPKEVIDHGTAIAGHRMIGLGGRKMVAHKLLRKLDPARPAGVNEETSTTTTSSHNSGEDSKASSISHGKPQNKLNQQDYIEILEATTPKSASAASTFEIPRDVKPKQPTKADRKTTSYDDDDDDNAEDHKLTDDDDADDHNLTDETRRLLKATREIVNLMHKDYHRMGNRKPPINNHEPQH